MSLNIDPEYTIKHRQRFTKEFKLEAERLVGNPDRQNIQIARELGISEALLYHWCKKFREADWFVSDLIRNI